MLWRPQYQMTKQALGKHILVEFYNCPCEILNDVVRIEKCMLRAAKEAEATIINSAFHHFSPFGVSGVVVIQESHLAIHTWPEFGYVALDIFTCGESVDPWIAYDVLIKDLQAEHGSAMQISRGQLQLLSKQNNVPNQQEILEERSKHVRNIWFTERGENMSVSFRHSGDVVFREKSPYQKVEVYDTYAYGKMLTIDGLVMCTEKDEHGYHEMITHVPMLTHPNPKNVLVIGGGDGGTIREITRYQDIEKVTLVEIDQVVIDAAKKHLPTISGAFDHPKLELHVADGIEFVRSAQKGTYDIIIVDSSEPCGPSEGLFTEDFYRNAYNALCDDGILVTQSESPRFNTTVFCELYDCYRKIFGNDKVHCYLAFIPTYNSGMWSFSYSSKGNIHPLQSFHEEKYQKLISNNALQYYNKEVHQAAFALPNFVRNMLKIPR